MAGKPLKVTADVLIRFVPLIPTTTGFEPLVGLKVVTVGTSLTTKSIVVVAVPPGVVTEMGPVVAPTGTWATTVKPLLTMEVITAANPLKVTADVLIRFVPLILTLVPGGPLNGSKLVSVGTSLTTKSVVVVAVPPGVVTEMGAGRH